MQICINMSQPGSYGERPPKSDEKNYGYITEIPREDEAIPGGMTTIAIIAVVRRICTTTYLRMILSCFL